MTQLLMVLVLMLLAINFIPPVQSTVSLITTAGGYDAGTVNFVGLYPLLMAIIGVYAVFKAFGEI